jgi:hypothetical protein
LSDLQLKAILLGSSLLSVSDEHLFPDPNKIGLYMLISGTCHVVFRESFTKITTAVPMPPLINY